MIVSALLLVVFLVHLVAFAFLGLRRRQPYYAALVVTFALLTATMALRVFAPGLAVADGIELAPALRRAAWAAAAVSVGWTLLRLRARRRRREPDG